MHFRIGGTLLVGVAALLLAQMARVSGFVHHMLDDRSGDAAGSVQVLDADVQVQLMRELPERVTALATHFSPSRSGEDVFVGTGPSGGVFRFSPSLPITVLATMASGLGDDISFGICEVNALAFCDLNQDGTPELLAETSQIMPAGRPRLYAWSLHQHVVPLAMARPEIESSWSHGLGSVQLAGRAYPTVFSTFCGRGEIVEYQLTHEKSPDGFQLEGISWRQVGQLPASGEQAATVDADNDGQIDLCVATGYSPGKAAVWIYGIGDDGLDPRPRHVIDESARFGNVRFLVGDLEAGGGRELLAWWCSDVCSGDCEVIQYRLDSDGVSERTVIARGDAEQLWPRDGQMALADVDQDGEMEVWFAAAIGNVWRYQPNQSPAVTQVCFSPGGAGPLAANTPKNGLPSCVYLGSGRSVVRLQSRAK
jgi:hypothetical protein